MTRSTLQLHPSVPPSRDVQLPVAGRHRRRVVRVVLWALGLIAVAAGVLVAYRSLAPPPATSVRIAGLIAANEVTVATQTAGRIRQLPVDEGDMVAAGSTIAIFDGSDVDAARRQQVAVVAELAVRLARGEEVVAFESQRVDGQIARARAELSAARSRLRLAEAELDDLRAETARVGQLVDQQLAPRRDRERLQAQVAVSAARRDAAGDEVAAADADLSLAQTNIRQVGLARRDVEQIRAQRQQAEAQLAQVDTRVTETTVVAPIAGMVSLRVVREGEVVNAGDPIVALVDPDDVWIRAAVDESVASGLALGDKLQVELLTGERRTGVVTFIAPEAGFATQRDVSRVRRDIRTFAIKVALANDDRRLHAGTTAFVLLPVAARAAP